MSSFVPIYAVDFDGTLCESKWPGIGAPNKKLIQHLVQRRSEGAKVILWTCRVEERLKEAVDWCSKFGLEFDAVNDNLPELVEKFGNNTRKIWATCYIDDNSGDREKYGIPYFAEADLADDTAIKYPVGSEWVLRSDGFKIPVRIEERNMIGNWILAVSISDNPVFQYFKIRREPEWFDGKLFPKE